MQIRNQNLLRMQRGNVNCYSWKKFAEVKNREEIKEKNKEVKKKKKGKENKEVRQKWSCLQYPKLKIMVKQSSKHHPQGLSRPPQPALAREI